MADAVGEKLYGVRRYLSALFAAHRRVDQGLQIRIRQGVDGGGDVQVPT